MAHRKKTARPKLKVGDRVKFPLISKLYPALIVEDRGHLGVGGRQIFRIRPLVDGLTTEPGNTFEYRADELIPFPKRPRRPQTPARTA